MGASAFGASWFGASAFGASWTDSAGGGGFQTFAMRSDQPIASIPVDLNLGARFHPKDWDTDLVSMIVVPQFNAAEINGKNWEQSITLPPPIKPTKKIIQNLLVLAVTERPEALGEILQQHRNFQVCWIQLLNMNPVVHPATIFLMKLAARVGEFAMITLKRNDKNRNVARPSQVCPTLYPPVAVPQHASYPAGHAVVAQLTSECLATVVPAHKKALDVMAQRCGRLRVIAGLHYEQDVEVGLEVGRKLHDFIRLCPLYQETLKAAKAEWRIPKAVP